MGHRIRDVGTIASTHETYRGYEVVVDFCRSTVRPITVRAALLEAVGISPIAPGTKFEASIVSNALDELSVAPAEFRPLSTPDNNDN